MGRWIMTSYAYSVKRVHTVQNVTIFRKTADRHRFIGSIHNVSLYPYKYTTLQVKRSLHSRKSDIGKDVAHEGRGRDLCQCSR